MEFVSKYSKKFFLAFLSLSIFDLMAIGLNVYVPISFITIIVLMILDIPGFLALITFYVFIM